MLLVNRTAFRISLLSGFLESSHCSRRIPLAKEAPNGHEYAAMDDDVIRVLHFKNGERQAGLNIAVTTRESRDEPFRQARRKTGGMGEGGGGVA
jgi:hypothetical protein